MKSVISDVIKNSITRIENNFPIECERDFQSIIFGELYKALPDDIIRFEYYLINSYQSYTDSRRKGSHNKSRVDIHVIYQNNPIVLEVKYIQKKGESGFMELILDIAKTERIVESQEANEGFCIQLVDKAMIDQLPMCSLIPHKCNQNNDNIYNYRYEIKNQYPLKPQRLNNCGHSLIWHHVN